MFPILLAFSMMLDAHVHGVVRDSASRQPLHGATVRVVGTLRGTIADRTGTFHLHDLPVADTFVLDVSHVGYVRRRVSVVVAGRTDIRIEVPMQTSAVQQDEVVVSDERTSTSALPTQQMRVLTAAEIDEHRGQTFADALRQVPGVTVVQTGPSIAKPMIHGMTGQRIVIRNGGVVQEGQQWGAEHAPEIDPFTPSRIVVVKGPASVMYGPNAMGGVIDVVRRPLPQQDGVHGEATANLFSNNLQGAMGAFVESRSIAETNIGVRLQASARRAGDAITGAGSAPPSPYRLTNTGFAEWNVSGEVHVGDDDANLRILGSLFSTRLGILSASHVGNAADLERAIERGYPDPTYPFSYTIGNPRQEISHATISLTGTWRVDRTNTLRATYGWQQNDRSEFDAHNTRLSQPDPSTLQRPAMNLLLSTYSLDAAWDVEQSSFARGTVGVRAQRQVNDRSGTVFLIPDYLAWTLGAFVYESVVISDVNVSGGLRYDVQLLNAVNQEKRFARLTASLGARWQVTDEFSAQSNVASSWRPPQVNELYADGLHHGSALYEIGDSTLQAEQSMGFDVGIRYAPEGFELEATAYVNSFDGYILALPDPDNPTITFRGVFPTYRFTQLPTVIAGGDVSATVAVTENLNAYATASMVRGTDLDNQQPLFMMPADRARVGAHIHAHDALFLHDAFADLSVMGVRRQTNVAPGQDYAEPPAGYVVCDVTIGGMVEISTNTQTRVSMSVLNVFNTAYRDYLSRYRYFADDPGRNVVLRFTTTF